MQVLEADGDAADAEGVSDFMSDGLLRAAAGTVGGIPIPIKGIAALGWRSPQQDGAVVHEDENRTTILSIKVRPS